jgi:hypothetical protein|tara:strand:- start:422 stop:817 length:396 start_codon:yes stop_codon:yes gene_type:complete
LALSRQALAERVGRAGELLAMSRLEMAGHRCHHVVTVADDAWIKTETGRILTLQIKSSNGIHFNGGRQYAFWTRSSPGVIRSDIYAFVALNLGLVYFMKKSDKNLKKCNTRIHKDLFTAENETKTMNKVLG